MDNTITERQRRYRKRLYEAGLKQAYVWIKRKEGNIPKKMSMTEFVRQLKKRTEGMDKETLRAMLNLFIKIANGKKEEAKLRGKR